MSMEYTIKAYAKINIALNVLGKLDNGYHEVDMVTLPIELHDIIELEPLPNGYETYITSDDESLPTDESNLSIKAFMKLREKANLSKNFMINIYKRIPMCAGLGGGSADAAAVINGALKLSKQKVDSDKLLEICANVGGDVAFCLYNKPARCRGIGEKLEFFELKRKYHVLLIKPLIGVSTGEVYNDYDNFEPKEKFSDIDKLILGLKTGNEDLIAQEMKNSLQNPAIALVPEIKDIIEQLKNDGFKMTMMSGSGSTVFALATDGHALLKESKKFDTNKYNVILTTTL